MAQDQVFFAALQLQKGSIQAMQQRLQLMQEQGMPLDINSKNTDGLTALHIATNAGRIDIVRFLLENGADPNIKTNAIHHVALHGAAAIGNVEIGQLLIENGADIDATTDIQLDETPLHYAAFHNQKNFVKFLLEHGANYKAINNQDKTPSQRASGQGHEEIARFIKNMHYQIKNQRTIQMSSEIRALRNDVRQLHQPQQNIEQLQIIQGNLAEQLRQVQQQAHKNYFPFFRPSFRPSAEMKIAVGVAFFCIGLMLAFDGDTIFENKYKFFGKSLIAMCTVVLVAYLADQIKLLKLQLARLTNEVIETIIAGRETINLSGRMLESGIETIGTLREIMTELNRTTNNVMVEIKDEVRDAIVSLTGNASGVARAIQQGIDNNRFKPEATAHINVNVNVSNNNIKVGSPSLISI